MQPPSDSKASSTSLLRLDCLPAQLVEAIDQQLGEKTFGAIPQIRAGDDRRSDGADRDSGAGAWSKFAWSFGRERFATVPTVARHQHCKYDRNENERGHISHQVTALGRIAEGQSAGPRPELVAIVEK